MDKVIGFFKGNWLTVLLILVAIGVVIYFVYRSGKSSGVNSVAPDIPGDSTVNPLTNEEKTKILSLVNRLHDDINGITSVAYRDWDTYTEFANSTDRVFVGVFNLYQSKYNVSLKTDMQGESYWIDQNPFTSQSPIETIFNRMNSLHLN